MVVGINGLGKTTLLNAIFRALSGPTDWTRRSLDKPAGSSPIKIGPWRTPAYFRQRVADEAANSTIEIEVSFANNNLLVRRSLRDLTLEELQLNGEETEATESNYREIIRSVSGVTQFEDFFLILRYLVFFLEERPPLVWDANAQNDILRVLFFDSAQSRAAREYFDRVQRADSRYRNLRPTYGKLKEQLANAQSANVDPGAAVEHAGVQVKLSALKAEQRHLDNELQLADDERKRLRLKHEQAKLLLAECRDAYATVEQHQLAAMFPDIGAVAKYVFLRADSGCLVCGSHGHAVVDRIRERTAAGHCPLCDTPTAEQESALLGGVLPLATAARSKLESLYQLVKDAEHNEVELQRALQSAVCAYDALLARALDVHGELSDASRTLERMGLSLPPTSKEFDELGAAMKALDNEMSDWLQKRQAAEVKYRRVLARGEERVSALALSIAERFSTIATAFLEERCDLQYTTANRRIGQEGAVFAFPQFTVRLTSAVSLNEPQPRTSTLDVSESQKEFIDLAFRMALMDVAAASTPLMLVLETPEASLDALFVQRAGSLFGDFAAKGGAVGNRLIASSNLTNNGAMISSLLGALVQGPEKASATRPPHYIAPTNRPSHVIDLLHEAAPNTALLEHRPLYDELLQQAIYPEPLLTSEPKRDSRNSSTRSGKSTGKRKKRPS